MFVYAINVDDDDDDYAEKPLHCTMYAVAACDRGIRAPYKA